MLRDVFSYSALRVTGVVVAATFTAAGARAGGPIITHKWVEVDNSTLADSTASGLNDGSFDGNIYRTFDLFVNLTQTVTTFDSGFTNNTGIQISGSSFFQFEPIPGTPNHLIPAQTTINAFPMVEFDSWVGIGDTQASAISTAGFTFDTSTLFGTWFTTSAFQPTEDGDVFVARFTVTSALGFGQDESATRFLGGQLLVGTGAGDSVTINISNAFATTGPQIPAPGAAAVLALAGLAGSRRRRG